MSEGPLEGEVRAFARRSEQISFVSLRIQTLLLRLIKKKGRRLEGGRECIFFAILLSRQKKCPFGGIPPLFGERGHFFALFLILSLPLCALYLCIRLTSFFSLSLSFQNNNRPPRPRRTRGQGQRMPPPEEEEEEVVVVVKKQPKQRPRNSALRSTVAFDNGLGAGACGRKLFFCPSATARGREDIFALSPVSFLSLSFILKKK